MNIDSIRYFIAIGFEQRPEVSGFYEALGAKLEERCGVRSLARRAPAHVTLVRPRERGIVEASRAVRDALQETTVPPRLEFDGIGWFDHNPREQSAYLAVRPDRDLLAFRERVRKRVADRLNEPFGEDEFVPHVSLARHLSGERARCVREYLAEYTVPRLAPMPVREVVVYSLQPGGAYRLHHRFPLEPADAGM